MAGPIIFVAFQVFLFGITNAQCPIPCDDAKIFAADEMCGGVNCNGTWNLKDPESVNCPQEWPLGSGIYVDVCLYRRNSDGKYMCFCDPGNCIYKPGQVWQGGLCYDNTNNPKLLQFIGNFPSFNSYAYCMAACIAANPFYTYFGLENGDECYCGFTQPPTLKHPQVFRCDCDTPCPGSPLTTCGGTNSIQVYAIPERIPDVEEGLCYNNNNARTLFTFLGNYAYNSAAYCKAACIAAAAPYTYFGLEDGVECFCGYAQPPTNDQVFRCDCNIPCPGAPLATCGGTNLIQVSAIY